MASLFILLSAPYDDKQRVAKWSMSSSHEKDNIHVAAYMAISDIRPDCVHSDLMSC